MGQEEELCEAIIRDATEGGSVGPLLRRMTVLGQMLGSESIKTWANDELNGYSGRRIEPSYRILTCYITAKIGNAFNSRSVDIDPRPYENRVGSKGGLSLSQYFLPISATEIEAYRGTGERVHFLIPGVDLRAFVNIIVKNGTCFDATFVTSASSYRGILDAVRNEAIRLVLSIGAFSSVKSAVIPRRQESSGTMTKTTIVNIPGQSGPVIIDSNISGSSIETGAQSISASSRPESTLLAADDETSFRAEVGEVLKLMIDRHEELDRTMRQALRAVLEDIRDLKLQGRTLAEVKADVDELWAASQVASMRLTVPQFVQEAVGNTEVLGAIAKVISAFVAPSP